MKKTLSLILLFSLCLSLAACGKSKENKGASSGELNSRQETASVLRWEEYYPFLEGSTVERVARIGSTFMIIGACDEKPILGVMDYVLSADGSVQFTETKLIDLETADIADKSKLYSLSAGGDGYFYILSGENAVPYRDQYQEWVVPDGYEGNFSILKFSAKGEFIDRLDINRWPDMPVPDIAVGHEGEIVLVGDETIAQFCWDEGYGKAHMVHETLSKEVGADRIYWFYVDLCDKGLVALFTFDDKNETEDRMRSTRFYLLGTDGNVERLPMDMLVPDKIIPNVLHGLCIKTCQGQGVNGEYLFVSSEILYDLDFDSGTAEEILRWNPIGKDGMQESDDWFTSVCRIAKKTFVGTMNEANDALHVIYEQSLSAKERSTVHVAIYGDKDLFCPRYEAMLDTYNATSGDYLYVYESYGVTEQERLKTVLATKDAPDLVVFDNRQNISQSSYKGVYLPTDSELFEDLYPYIDSDPNLSREDFIPNLLELMEQDGRLTQMWTGVYVLTLVARAADVEEGVCYSPADYSDILDGSDRYKDKGVFDYGMDRNTLLAYISSVAVSAYIDKETATCSFGSDSFWELLQWVKEEGSDINDYMTPDGGFADGFEFKYRWNESLLYFDQIQGMGMVPNAAMWAGEPYVYVGVPHGENSDHLYVSSGLCLAIPTMGDNKEGAWAFIRDNLKTTDEISAIPVLTEDMERIAAEIELDSADYEQFLELLRDTKLAINYSDEPLRDIIMENGQAYLAGDKTLEEAVALIQNRASVYMSEKYG